ncbi:hypothetical protein J3F84DRAFT_389173, partial [Trichoderma pleuroticola]
MLALNFAFFAFPFVLSLFDSLSYLDGDVPGLANSRLPAGFGRLLPTICLSISRLRQLVIVNYRELMTLVSGL